MAHKVGRKVFGNRNRPDFLGISNQPAPAAAPAPAPAPLPAFGGADPSQLGGMNLGGQPAQIEQPMPVQQGMPCPDPSAHTQQAPVNQMQTPGAMAQGQTAFNNRFPGMARPSMMPMPMPMPMPYARPKPRPFFGGFRGLF